MSKTPPRRNRANQINLVIHESLQDWMKEEAARRYCSVSGLVRTLVLQAKAEREEAGRE
jgi:hypothetical protein